jgi:outer membrane cobalamin receptor
MRIVSLSLPAWILVLTTTVSAAQIEGKVLDPSGAPVAGAQISVWNRTGAGAQTTSLADGSFVLDAPLESKLVVMAPGFRTVTVEAAHAETVRLEIAPVVDSVSVVGSNISAPLEQQGSSVSLIPPSEVRRRNEPYAADLLRYLPGVTLNQSGGPGSVSSLFLRGGNSNFALVRIDGVPVNAFGGGFDFAHIPALAIDQIEVIRGPQSAVYGPYANSGEVDFITRQPSSTPELEIVAEGGSYGERQFGWTASGMMAGFGLAAAASRIDTNGPVTNSDYRNENLLLNITRRFQNQNLAFHANFDSNEAGEAGPWGSDPKHTFTGIDTVSRVKNNFGSYGAHWDAELSSRARQQVSGGFFLDRSGFQTPFGPSFNQDRRFQGESLTVLSVNSRYTAAFGVSAGREDVKNSFISDARFTTFPIQRMDLAVYEENRLDLGGRLFLNAGARIEWIRTSAIPGDGFTRPDFPAHALARINPKIAGAFKLNPETRLHASVGMGIRPPTGFELAFTNNPRLAPERTRSVDAGVERKLLHDALQLDATYFYNRYYDLIVTLGGSLATLSHYTSANLANSQAQGAEFTAAFRPARWVFLRGSYTLLETRILSIDGSTLAPLPFAVGQPLTRRPEHSGSFVATLSRGRATADFTGYFRGKALFEEPTFGASNGLFWNPGFANLGVNLNYELASGVTLFGHLRNALNQHYEEVFGYPSLRLNFVAGVKWTLARRR